MMPVHGSTGYGRISDDTHFTASTSDARSVRPPLPGSCQAIRARTSNRPRPSAGGNSNSFVLSALNGSRRVAFPAVLTGGRGTSTGCPPGWSATTAEKWTGPAAPHALTDGHARANVGVTGSVRDSPSPFPGRDRVTACLRTPRPPCSVRHSQKTPPEARQAYQAQHRQERRDLSGTRPSTRPPPSPPSAPTRPAAGTSTRNRPTAPADSGRPTSSYPAAPGVGTGPVPTGTSRRRRGRRHDQPAQGQRDDEVDAVRQ